MFKDRESADDLRGVGTWTSGDKSTDFHQGSTSSTPSKAKEPKGLGTVKEANPLSQTTPSKEYSMDRFLNETEKESGVVVFAHGSSAASRT